jgi:hypothetical protein
MYLYCTRHSYSREHCSCLLEKEKNYKIKIKLNNLSISMYVPVLGMSPDELPGPVSVGHDLARRPVGEELPVVAGEHAHYSRALQAGPPS